jgi:uncharacterized membrane protein YeiH
VTAAALAAGVYVVLAVIGTEPAAAASVAFTMGFGLRALAIVKQLSLPSYHGQSDIPGLRDQQNVAAGRPD